MPDVWQTRIVGITLHRNGRIEYFVRYPYMEDHEDDREVPSDLVDDRLKVDFHLRHKLPPPVPNNAPTLAHRRLQQQLAAEEGR